MSLEHTQGGFNQAIEKRLKSLEKLVGFLFGHEPGKSVVTPITPSTPVKPIPQVDPLTKK